MSAHPPLLTRRQNAAAALGGNALNTLMRTTSVRTRGEENFRQFWDRKQPTVFTLWHGRLLPCTYHHRHQDVATIISQHRDGEYINRVVRKWGYHTVRGSSSRGGVEALRELVKHLRAGRSVAITPDGPRGPREKMKPGPLLAAQLSGAPIIPTVSGASRAWYFGGWDRFLIPKPFARLQVLYGEPVFVPRRASESELQAISDEVEARLGELMKQVDQPWG
ncbi:MAG TPA: lysophospholipid acyltransferase family protein [Longimicrobium sp.]